MIQAFLFFAGGAVGLIVTALSAATRIAESRDAAGRYAQQVRASAILLREHGVDDPAQAIDDLLTNEPERLNQ